MSWRASGFLQRVCGIVLAGAVIGGPAAADDLLLKSGITLRGTVLKSAGLNSRTIGQNNRADVTAATYWMCDDGVRRYFVQRRQAPDVIDADLTRGILFQLTHERRGSKGIPSTLGLYQKTDFDKYGRRLIELQTPRGKEPVNQAITEIRPEYLKVESTDHNWVMGLDVTTIPPELLREIIGQSIDPQRIDDLKAVVAFFIQIGRYAQAKAEVEQIAAKFPEQTGRADSYADVTRTEIQHLEALAALQEIRRRLTAGQYLLAYRFANAVPEDKVSADVMREARDLVVELDGLLARRNHVLSLLDLLQAELPQEQAQQLAPMHSTVVSELHPESLPRLDPFLRAEKDEGLKPAEKLALAYSGWVIGSGNAVTDLEEAIRLWHARFLVLEYLRSEGHPAEREALVEELLKIDGVTLPRVVDMIANMPPPLTPPTLTPGQPAVVDVIDAYDNVRRQYTVSLPSEYSPQHAYPLLVVLHPGGMSPEQELTLWTGTPDQPGPAFARGYVTIAPHFAEGETRRYDYSSDNHAAVMESINDARKRYRIDSDRIYLAGHGIGGNACFDLGMSHPGVFAGIAAIDGIIDRFCRYYRLNDPQAAWYVVNGELHGDQNGMALSFNADNLNYMMKAGQDVLYCEFKKRGFETYFEEFNRIFDWFAAHRREPQPREIGTGKSYDEGVGILRPFDTRFHWLEVSGLPSRLSDPILWDSAPKKNPSPLMIKGKFTANEEANTVYVQHPGSKTTIWLSPDLVTFDKRITVNLKGKNGKFSEIVRPDLGVLLEDLRVRGDRERLYWAKIEL